MEKRTLLKNSIFNVSYKILNIVFPLLTSMYVARVLLADSIGKVAAAQNVVSYFTLLAGMGIPTYGVKLIAQYETKCEESNKAFSELFIINFALTSLCSIIYYIMIFFIPYFAEKEVLYFVCGLVIPFNIFNVDWFYQGIQKYGYIAIRSLIFKCISLFAIICTVHSPDDYILYAFISSGALVGNYIFNIFHIKKYTCFIVKGLHFTEHFRHIAALFLAGIASEIYVLADTTMLDVLCGSSIVGYYTMSQRVIRVIRGLVVAISSVFLPQMSYYYFNGKIDEFYGLTNAGIHALTVLSVPAAAGVFLTADEAMIVFYGNNFTHSIFTTKILALSIITVALSNFIGLQFFVTLGKGNLTTISTIFGAFANIILNLFLIKHYQHVGAAVASVITEGLVAIIQLYMSRKYVKFHFGFNKVIPSVLCMILFVLLLDRLDISAVFKLFLKCGLGMGVYFFVLYIMKDELVLQVCNIFQSKVRKLL